MIADICQKHNDDASRFELLLVSSWLALKILGNKSFMCVAVMNIKKTWQ